MAAEAPPEIIHEWILYIAHGDTNSDRAIECASHPLVGITRRDVRTMARDDIPTYVDGVPVLANSKTKIAYKGTYAITQLKKLSNGVPVPAPAHSSVFSGFETQHAVDTMGAPAGLTATTPTSFDVSDRNVTSADVDAYLRHREKSTASHSHTPTPPAAPPGGGDSHT